MFQLPEHCEICLLNSNLKEKTPFTFESLILCIELLTVETRKQQTIFYGIH